MGGLWAHQSRDVMQGQSRIPWYAGWQADCLGWSLRSGFMGVDRASPVEHPPVLGFGAESASSSIYVPLIPQGAL